MPVTATEETERGLSAQIWRRRKREGLEEGERWRGEVSGLLGAYAMFLHLRSTMVTLFLG
jgi:hypothetical protein